MIDTCFLQCYLWAISVVNELAQWIWNLHIFIYICIYLNFLLDCCSWHTKSAFTPESTLWKTPKQPFCLNRGHGWMCDSIFYFYFFRNFCVLQLIQVAVVCGHLLFSVRLTFPAVWSPPLLLVSSYYSSSSWLLLLFSTRVLKPTSTHCLHGEKSQLTTGSEVISSRLKRRTAHTHTLTREQCGARTHTVCHRFRLCFSE